jgi:hypothetical protein
MRKTRRSSNNYTASSVNIKPKKTLRFKNNEGQKTTNIHYINYNDPNKVFKPTKYSITRTRGPINAKTVVPNPAALRRAALIGQIVHESNNYQNMLNRIPDVAKQLPEKAQNAIRKRLTKSYADNNEFAAQ